MSFKFVANTPGQVLVKISGPQAAGKSLLARNLCESLQESEVSYHYEDGGEMWESFDPKRVPALVCGKPRRVHPRNAALYSASVANAKYLVLVS